QDHHKSDEGDGEKERERLGDRDQSNFETHPATGRQLSPVEDALKMGGLKSKILKNGQRHQNRVEPPQGYSCRSQALAQTFQARLLHRRPWYSDRLSKHSFRSSPQRQPQPTKNDAKIW